MKTIEERAKEYADGHKATEFAYFGSNRCYSYERVYNAEIVSYERGAKEQKAIDDAECANQVLMGKGSSINYYKQGYHDAIEKACEWLGVHLAEVADRYDYTASLLLRHVKENFRKAMEKEL